MLRDWLRSVLGSAEDIFPNGERVRTFELHEPRRWLRGEPVRALRRHAERVYLDGDDRVLADLTLEGLRAAHEDPALEGNITLVPVREET